MTNNTQQDGLKTSAEWNEDLAEGIHVIDPDGWDRVNFQISWYDEKIDREEFERRFMLSTVQYQPTSSIWRDKHGE